MQPNTTTAGAQYLRDRWSDSPATTRWLRKAAHKAERQGAKAFIAEGLAELD